MVKSSVLNEKSSLCFQPRLDEPFSVNFSKIFSTVESFFVNTAAILSTDLSKCGQHGGNTIAIHHSG